MKNLLILACLLISTSLYSQNRVDTTFIVKGNCGHCKERIQEAVDLRGVSFANWDSESQELHIVYRKNKISLEAIEAAILGAGHDLNDKKAKDSVYNDLAKCCQFRNGKSSCGHKH
jgi:copper chaperone CopZ